MSGLGDAYLVRLSKVICGLGRKLTCAACQGPGRRTIQLLPGNLCRRKGHLKAVGRARWSGGSQHRLVGRGWELGSDLLKWTELEHRGKRLLEDRRRGRSSGGGGRRRGKFIRDSDGLRHRIRLCPGVGVASERAVENERNESSAAVSE